MTPETISERESKFALKLIDSTAKQFTAGNKIDIGNGFTIELGKKMPPFRVVYECPREHFGNTLFRQYPKNS